MNTRKLSWRSGAPEKVSMVIAGDFCPREQNCDDLVSRVDEITAQVKPFFDDADFKILQWECTVTRQDTPIPKGGPNHRCYPECTVFATALGIDTVLLANNHTGDYGAPGVKDTLDAFDKLHINTVGAGMTEADAARPLHLEKNGIKISILNSAEYEFGIAYGDTPGSYATDPIKLSAQIKAEKAAGFKVIVTLHGGHELYSYPTPRLRSLCRFLADCGADVVYNCHTHCPLGYEIYNNIPIIYSPGNFYFPNRPTSLPCWYIGYLPKFTIDADGAFELEILPYYNRKQALGLMDDGDTEKFFSYLDGLSAPIADESALQKLFDAWCAAGGINGYFGTLFNRPIPDTFENYGGKKANLGLRNLFTCQSHHDLLRNTLLLMERGQLKNAAELIPAIRAAQAPEWVNIKG